MAFNESFRVSTVVTSIGFFLLAAPVQAQTYTAPKASAALLQGINFSKAKPVGERFKKRFDECDTKNTCDGKKMKFGCASDKNNNTALLDVGGRAILFEAKMGLDADGSPLSKPQTGTNQAETSYRYPLPGEPSVDADKVPYIVIPLDGFDEELGVVPGDVAAVISGGKLSFAIVADEGPKCKIGEGSIELHGVLGHKVCLQRNEQGECTKLRDVGIDKGVIYIIFKDSNKLIQEGLSPQNVNERLVITGRKLFDELRSADRP